MGGTGLEPVRDSSGKNEGQSKSGAQSGALSPVFGQSEMADQTDNGAGLRAAVDAWQALSEDDRRRFLAIIW
jgi:hypothetical protein